MDDGFEVLHSSALKSAFKTGMENKRPLPMAFYYKGFGIAETA